jgi:hypothetical protein
LQKISKYAPELYIIYIYLALTDFKWSNTWPWNKVTMKICESPGRTFKHSSLVIHFKSSILRNLKCKFRIKKKNKVKCKRNSFSPTVTSQASLKNVDWAALRHSSRYINICKLFIIFLSKNARENLFIHTTFIYTSVSLKNNRLNTVPNICNLLTVN